MSGMRALAFVDAGELRNVRSKAVAKQRQEPRTGTGKLFRRLHKTLPPSLGAVTLASVGLLLAADVLPGPLAREHHGLLGAVPLALIAIAYLLHQTVLRPAPKEVFKTVLIAAAFLFWAANQVLSDPIQALLCNDVAIALFVLDVFLVIIGWPPTPPDEGFAETSRDLEHPRSGET